MFGTMKPDLASTLIKDLIEEFLVPADCCERDRLPGGPRVQVHHLFLSVPLHKNPGVLISLEAEKYLIIKISGRDI